MMVHGPGARHLPVVANGAKSVRLPGLESVAALDDADGHGLAFDNVQLLDFGDGGVDVATFGFVGGDDHGDELPCCRFVLER